MPKFAPTFFILILLFLVPAGSAATPLVTDHTLTAAANPVVSVDQTGTESAVSNNSSIPPSSKAADGRVHIIIFFKSPEARANATFVSPEIDIRGGYDVDFVPVLFATAPQAAISHLESRAGVDDLVWDKSIKLDYGTNAAISGQETVVATDQTVPWGVERIGARTASVAIPDDAERGVTVAILDTGIDYNHPDLDNNVVWGANFSNGVSERGLKTSKDNNGHGTAAAGIVAAEDDGTGVIGVAPRTRLYSIKVLNKDGVGRVSWLLEGMQASLEGPDGEIGTADDADILSLSLSSTSDSDSLRTAVEQANDHAAIVVGVGNNGDDDPSTNEIGYPARYPDAIGVAATDRDDETPSFSAEGDQVELAAPGVFIETTASGGGTTSFSGTSAATPHAAGAVALVLASDLADGERDLTMADIRYRLQETATDIEADGIDRKAGYGLIQVKSAIVTTGNINVQIKDLDGQTLSNIEAELYREDDWSGSRENPIAVLPSDSQGFVTFSGLPVGADSDTPEEYVIRAGNSNGEYRSAITTVSLFEPSSTSKSATLYLSSVTQPPEPSLRITPTNAEVNQSITFDGSNSSASDGEITEYRWDFDGDGTADQITQTASLTYTYFQVGTYDVELTVVDNNGETASTTQTVSVAPQPPEASLRITPTNAEVNQSITFDGRNSSASDGKIAEYRWDFDGDGTVDRTTQTPSLVHTYSEAGTYDAKLTVVDNNAGTASATQTVSVAPFEPPGVITGIVTDEGTNPISNASVTIENTTGSVVANITSTEAGEYTVEVPPGDYTAIAESNGHTGRATVTVDPSRTSVANIVILDNTEPDPPTAERNLSGTEVAPREIVTVTIDVELSETGGVQIKETFDSRLEAEITNGFGSLDNIGNKKVVFNNPTGTSSQYTVKYQLIIPADATIGTTYNFTGTVQGSSEATISGDSSITVLDGAWYDSYTKNDDVVSDEGFNAAISDYLRNEITGSQINTIIRSYLSGQPIEA